MCVCVRERERERKGKGGKEAEGDVMCQRNKHVPLEIFFILVLKLEVESYLGPRTACFPDYTSQPCS